MGYSEYMKYIIALFSISLFLLFMTIPAEAIQQGTVLINEIAWMGTKIDGIEPNQWWRYEWLELYNSSNTPVKLDDWSVELHRETLEFKTILKGTIPAQGYFVVAASDKVPHYDFAYLNLGGEFINAGQRVVLKNAQGVIEEEIDARAGWPAGSNENKATMERTSSSTQEWHTSSEPFGTLKKENSEGIKEILQEDARVIALGEEKTPSSRSFPVSDFSQALAIAGMSALGVVVLRRYLQKHSQELS